MADPNRIEIYNYDVFISYKSEQESWARRLAETLRGFGLKVWRDHDAGDGIRVGEEWNEEIRSGIAQSKIMIVLWSKLVAQNANTLVLQEIGYMDDLRRNDPLRRFIPVSLDGTSSGANPILGRFHADVSLQELYKDTGDQQASDVSSLRWHRAIRPLLEVLGIKDITEVRFAVVAMTNAQAHQLFDHPELYAQDRETFEGIRAVVDLTWPFDVERYGSSPNSWHPFPPYTDTIQDLISFYVDEKQRNSLHAHGEAKWLVTSYSDELASDNNEEWRDAIETLRSGSCLVMIDMVSLLHKDVFARMITGNTLHTMPKSFVIGVAPYFLQMQADLFTRIDDIEKGLQKLIQEPYARFKSFLSPTTMPACSILSISTSSCACSRSVPIRSSSRSTRCYARAKFIPFAVISSMRRFPDARQRNLRRSEVAHEGNDLYLLFL